MIKLPVGDQAFSKQKDVLRWGEKEFNIVKPKLKNFRLCLDIGAHVGITTIRYSSHFQEVHSFEPIHYDLLVENTNHLKNVFAYNFAISDKNSSIKIYPNPINSGAGIIPDKNTAKIIQNRYIGENSRYKDRVKPITVKCSRLDDFGLIDIDMIKIDVEGHIGQVINGMNETLKNNSPVIQIEMSKYPEFQKLNRRVHSILSGYGYKKFEKYDEDHFYDKS